MPNPFENRVTVGIDLGTTMSSVAYVDEQNNPCSIRNSAGDFLTPSTILFEESGPVFGKDASNGAAFSPDSYVECFKRKMGNPPDVVVNGVEVPNEVLSAFLLDKLRRDAESTLGRAVSDAVVTVPAYFDEVRRQSTCIAAEMAGINVLEIINEPTAAAIRYGVGLSPESAEHDDRGRTVLVYDLGGGTFDVTILKITEQQLLTIATDGDVFLGGKDFDERLVEYMARKFMKEHGLDPRTDPNDHAQLWMDAEEIKKGLSVRDSVRHVLYHSGIRMRIEVSRKRLEEATADLLGRTRTTTNLVMKQAEKTWAEIDDIVVVGGSSRMPMVREMLESISGKSVSASVDPDLAIGQGAAVYASLFSTQRSSSPIPSIVNVNSHSLGVEGLNTKKNRRVNSIVIPRNTPIPACVVRKFKTARDDQRSVKVTVLEGESQRPESCVKLGTCTVRDLPAGLPAGTSVYVEMGYDLGGCLTLSAKLPATRQSANTRIDRASKQDFGSLEEWEAKICAAPVRDGKVRVNLQTLDAALIEIGKKHISTNPEQSATLDDLQEKMNQLQSEITSLEKTQASNKDRPIAIKTASDLSDKHIEMKQLASRRDLVLIVMGREVVARQSSETDDEIDKARQLIAALSSV